jgi:hypothetical protein
MVIVALPLQALMFFTILASLDGVYKLHVGLVTPPKGCLFDAADVPSFALDV